ncbi:hypothetical protein BX659_102142 [Orenia metallireducens]|jgi:hypothetical protein|uniref:Uncharacterized protein n=1 Tax=Orenia metallireducens TaxID=1413210 RepID=A0A285F382_9FIRM|nr:hypothetical protein [Orenia metallireducens]PRX34827.1 hypothetical protein BX659_102142 [Orenia metallireducens]SNY05780.1 hypothetical protein SAMN06265827_101141 [Orenia metallireducens]
MNKRIIQIILVISIISLCITGCTTRISEEETRELLNKNKEIYLDY